MKDKIKLLKKTATKTEAVDKSDKQEPEKQSSVVTWGPAASIIVVIAIYVVAQIIALFVVNLYPLVRHWDSAQASSWINNSVVGQFWFVVIVEGLSVYFLYLFLKRRHSNFKSIGLGRWIKWSILVSIM